MEYVSVSPKLPGFTKPSSGKTSKIMTLKNAQKLRNKAARKSNRTAIQREPKTKAAQATKNSLKLNGI